MCMEVQHVKVRWQPKVNSPFFLGLGPRIGREEGIFGLFAPKPNIRGSLGAYWPYKIKL